MDSDHPFRFRAGTWDHRVFRNVVEGNEYGLPDRFGPDDLVVDLGTHIGSFCHAAAIRGAGRVFGFEAEPGNFALAVENLRPHGGRVRVENLAVWRSDRGPTTLSFHASRNPANTGGGNVWFGGDLPVEAVPFDNVIRAVTRRGRRRVRFLKIGCEGSEFPILLTAKTLHLIDEIAGTYHEFGGDLDRLGLRESIAVAGYERLTIAELTEALQRAGFRVESSRNGQTNVGRFHAVNTLTPASRSPYPKPWLFRLRNAWRRSAGRSR